MFLSALEDVKNKTRGFEVGGNDYLTKPFEVLEVKARVRSLLKAKAYADAVREAMARDLRIAREIQMGILPADLAGGDERHRPGRARDHRAGAEGRRRSLRGAARLRRPRRRRAGRRVGKGHSGRALHGRRRDDAAHARPADRRPGRDSAPPQRRARRSRIRAACSSRCSAWCSICEHAPRVVRGRRDTTSWRSCSPGRPPRLACPSSGRPAGLMPFNPIERETFPLEPGDTFVLFSDGVSEAMNATEDFYGEERLLTALSASAGDVGRGHGRDGAGRRSRIRRRREAIGRHHRPGRALCALRKAARLARQTSGCTPLMFISVHSIFIFIEVTIGIYVSRFRAEWNHTVLGYSRGCPVCIV